MALKMRLLVLSAAAIAAHVADGRQSGAVATGLPMLVVREGDVWVSGACRSDSTGGSKNENFVQTPCDYGKNQNPPASLGDDTCIAGKIEGCRKASGMAGYEVTDQFWGNAKQGTRVLVGREFECHSKLLKQVATKNSGKNKKCYTFPSGHSTTFAGFPEGTRLVVGDATAGVGQVLVLPSGVEIAADGTVTLVDSTQVEGSKAGTLNADGSILLANGRTVGTDGQTVETTTTTSSTATTSTTSTTTSSTTTTTTTSTTTSSTTTTTEEPTTTTTTSSTTMTTSTTSTTAEPTTTAVPPVALTLPNLDITTADVAGVERHIRSELGRLSVTDFDTIAIYLAKCAPLPAQKTSQPRCKFSAGVTGFIKGSALLNIKGGTAESCEKHCELEDSCMAYHYSVATQECGIKSSAANAQATEDWQRQ